jgi:hypothetical protein
MCDDIDPMQDSRGGSLKETGDCVLISLAVLCASLLVICFLIGWAGGELAPLHSSARATELSPPR